MCSGGLILEFFVELDDVVVIFICMLVKFIGDLFIFILYILLLYF